MYWVGHLRPAITLDRGSITDRRVNSKTKLVMWCTIKTHLFPGVSSLKRRSRRTIDISHYIGILLL